MQNNSIATSFPRSFPNQNMYDEVIAPYQHLKFDIDEFCNKIHSNFWFSVTIGCYGSYTDSTGVSVPRYCDSVCWKYAPTYTKFNEFVKNHRFSMSQDIIEISTLVREYIGEERISEPNPEWVKAADIELLSNRLKDEFDTLIFWYGEKCFALLKSGEIFDIATGEGEFTVEQGTYNGKYFPKLGKNLAQRLPFLTLRQSLHLSRETVKSYLHRPATKISNKDFETWFNEWLGNSSWKSKYWFHHDNEVETGSGIARVSVVANHAKDLLIVRVEDGFHVYSGKNRFLVKRLPHVFYKFAKASLIEGKDYSVSGTDYPLYW